MLQLTPTACRSLSSLKVPGRLVMLVIGIAAVNASPTFAQTPSSPSTSVPTGTVVVSVVGGGVVPVSQTVPTGNVVLPSISTAASASGSSYIGSPLSSLATRQQAQQLGSTDQGQYCTDSSGGQLFVPRGSTVDPGYQCSGATSISDNAQLAVTSTNTAAGNTAATQPPATTTTALTATGSAASQPSTTNATALTGSGNATAVSGSSSSPPATQSNAVAAPTTAAVQPSPSLAIVAHDGSYDVPSSMAAGLESITFNNTGSQPHDLQLLRLDPDMTPDKIATAAGQVADASSPAAMLAAYAALYGHVTPYGGADLNPGQTASETLDLATGNYVVLDVASNTPAVSTSFQVANPESQLPAPSADAQVVEHDFSFDVPATIKSGNAVVKVSNHGNQPHEMTVFQIASGYTMQDVIAHLSDPTPPPFVTLVGGLETIAPNVDAWLTLNLSSGNYGLVSFVVDPTTGQTDAQQGMVAGFTVQ